MTGGVTSYAKLLRIGELAKRAGKSVRALHLYEELGLLHPSHRSRGGFRLYHPASVARVEWITKLQDAGFSLNALKELLHDVEFERAAPEAMKRVRAVFEEKLENDLLASLEYLDGCKSCESVHKPTECCTCSINGHESQHQPILVAGLHNS